MEAPDSVDWTASSAPRRTSASTSANGALLKRIGDLLRQDTKRPNLTGRIAVGVKQRAGGCSWLVANCGAELSLEWTTEYPAFDAALGLDEHAAADLLNGRVPAPEHLCIKTGDTDLLSRFIERYFSESSGLTLLHLRLRGHP